MVHERRYDASRGRCPARTRCVARASLAVFAIAVPAAGCATMRDGTEAGGGAADLTCNSAQQCRVKVTVACTPSCAPAVDHPHVFARGNAVVWEIVNQPGQSYSFAGDDGIRFKSEPGRSAFRCRREASGNRVACANRGDNGEFEYAVHVAGSPAVAPLDPWVVNH